MFIAGLRTGANIKNYRFGKAITNVFSVYGNPRESDFECGMTDLWFYSFLVIPIFFVLNFTGFFME